MHIQLTGPLHGRIIVGGLGQSYRIRLVRGGNREISIIIGRLSEGSLGLGWLAANWPQIHPLV